MSKFRVGDEVRSLHTRKNPNEKALLVYGDLYSGCIEARDGNGRQVWRYPEHFEPANLQMAKEQRAIARKEAELAVLKEAAAKKAKQAAERRAKRERAKIMRRLSPAGKRVVAMLQSGSAQDFGCQRENVINLAAAITGDRADDIRNALK